jgi:hypothetical protein
MTTVARVVRVALLTILAVATVSACAVLAPTRTAPPVETLETWSAQPLPPSADLAAKFLDPQNGCHLGIEGGIPLALLQDRRTEWTAAFIASDPTIFGVCFISTIGGSSGAANDPLLPTDELLTAEYRNVFEVSPGVNARVVAGRAPDAARVAIELLNGESIIASVGNGYWLGWWPQNAGASHVTAFDADGVEIASVEVEP